MPGVNALVGRLVSRADEGQASHAFSATFVAATICLIWYCAVSVVCLVGSTQLFRYYSRPPPSSKSAQSSTTAPYVTIIRPLKGLEPNLYQCLAATFLQDYPKDKLTIFFCVPDRNDPAGPVLKQLLDDFPGFDAQCVVEEDDPALQGHGAQQTLGPNPKIRNMSRAYREAKGDIVWIIDCNVWVAKGACGRMVDTLIGNRGIQNKFVHLLPLVVDVAGTPVSEGSQALLGTDTSNGQFKVFTSSTESHQLRTDASFDVWKDGGGRIEELFMSSAHAKFYTAINTVLVAPCIVGKSTMFRRSHLNSLTEGKGIDFFSENICEDHLIGDLLWKKQVTAERQGQKWGKHAMVFGDLAIQPMAGMSVREYIARRVRWLRVRKFTVTLATFVEPGTESFLCSLYGAYAFTTLPFFHDRFAIPQTWTAFALIWLASVSLWCFMDWTLYKKLHSGASIETDEHTPTFALPPTGSSRRPFTVWLWAWLAREGLAGPIWLWAVYGGATVAWRGKKFWVGMDMKVHEISPEAKGQSNGKTSHVPLKTRQD
ncbi:hypothetical protein AAFC00_000602 [Neodothiora populina]|uniref:Ceramide glucosyltransferase n=1 Tax=Neodothiora populina TaxID=2781224 RepID=A0ABR3PDZ2_9PEZI